MWDEGRDSQPSRVLGESERSSGGGGYVYSSLPAEVVLVVLVVVVNEMNNSAHLVPHMPSSFQLARPLGASDPFLPRGSEVMRNNSYCGTEKACLIAIGEAGHSQVQLHPREGREG